jgi:hypothetical protein
MWEPISFLIGKWEGVGSGQPSSGRYERSYEFVLNDHFIFERNKSTYPPQEQNPKGEVHENWGFISYDKGRKNFVYRQFHVEGFVNQFIFETHSSDFQSFSFLSESIENIPPGWRVKESYHLLSPDEFTETFKLAEPGKDYEVYTDCHLKRVKSSIRG